MCANCDKDTAGCACCAPKTNDDACGCCAHDAEDGDDQPAPSGGTTGEFRVSGLDCPDCAAGLLKRLRKADGITQASLNAATGLLVVTHRLSPAEIITLVAQAGYTAVPAASTAPAPRGFLQTHFRLLTTVLSAVLLVLGWLGDHASLSPTLVIPLYVGAILIGGFWTIRRGLSSLLARIIDMNVLMTIAVAGAAIIGQWEEGAAVAVLYSISNLLESYSMEKTRQSIRGLMGLAPREALVRRDGREARVPIEDVRVDDLVIVHPGEKIAMDGVVVAGSSAVNQAAITGESLPVEKSIGDEVFAGTLNALGTLDVRVTQLAADSTLARIIHLVEEAQIRRAPAQAFIDRFAKYYTPAMLALAALVAIVPPLFFAQPWGDWFYRALALIVVACPCALVISTPVAIVTAIGNAARHGVLIKGGAFLERAASLTVIAFDKTGTLTRGRPEVTDIIPLNGLTTHELLAVAAAVERRSPHPLAESVVRMAAESGVRMLPTVDCRVLPGKGALATVDGHVAYVGNLRLMHEYGIDIAVATPHLTVLERAGKTVMIVGVDGKALGIIAAADQVRPESKSAIAALHRVGIRRVVMLTGDHHETARRIADEVGVDEFRAELLPEGKVDAVRALGKGESIGMVGDGINDAPALAGADVGIAMGVAGTDTALETADIALMADDLNKLPYTIALSRKAMNIIRQNIVLAILIKLAAIVLASFGLLTLWLAVLSDMGASLLVTVNALRLVAEKPPEYRH